MSSRPAPLYRTGSRKDSVCIFSRLLYPKTTVAAIDAQRRREAISVIHIIHRTISKRIQNHEQRIF